MSRDLIDYAAQDDAVNFRAELYAAIHDRVTAHIEAKKQEIAQGLLNTEEMMPSKKMKKEEEKWHMKKEEDKPKHGMHEEVLDEDTMTHITLGKKVKNDQGGHDQDVSHKGKKIGSISSYKHRTGMRWGMNHDESGDATAGSRSPEEAISDLRQSHAQHLSDTKVKKEGY